MAAPVPVTLRYERALFRFFKSMVFILHIYNHQSTITTFGTTTGIVCTGVSSNHVPSRKGHIYMTIASAFTFSVCSSGL